MDDHEMDAGGHDDHIEKVRRRAHAIWLDQGMLHGRDQEHWREAEREIAAEEAERATPKAVEPTQSGELPVKDAPIGAAGESSVKGAEESPIKSAFRGAA